MRCGRHIVDRQGIPCTSVVVVKIILVNFVGYGMLCRVYLPSWAYFLGMGGIDQAP